MSKAQAIFGHTCRFFAPRQNKSLQITGTHTIYLRLLRRRSITRPLSTSAKRALISMASTSMSPKQNIKEDNEPYMLTFQVPCTDTASVCAKLCASSDAGTYPGGLYTEAYFTTRGTGQFRSMEGSNPTIGAVGEVEKVAEDKVEILCVGKACVKRAVEVLKQVHPYEQVPWFVVKGENVEDWNN